MARRKTRGEGQWKTKSCSSKVSGEGGKQQREAERNGEMERTQREAEGRAWRRGKT